MGLLGSSDRGASTISMSATVVRPRRAAALPENRMTGAATSTRIVMVKQGLIIEQLIDSAVRGCSALGSACSTCRARALKRIPMGVLDQPARALARQVARESIVLLKNAGNVPPPAKTWGPSPSSGRTRITGACSVTTKGSLPSHHTPRHSQAVPPTPACSRPRLASGRSNSR
jgi:beta-glucosidase-like glycosyl hydrolase